MCGVSRPPLAQGAGALVAVLALILCAFGFTLATDRVSNDVTSASLASWQIAQTGTPWLEDVDWQNYQRESQLWIGEAANGHTVAFRSPGPVAAGIPAYLTARVVGVDGYSPIPGSVLAVLLTAAALALLFPAIRTRLEPRVAAAAVLALGLTTPVWSVSADALWTHPVTLLGIAGMAWASARERWWLVGLFGAVALWGRLHTTVIVALLGLLLCYTRRRPTITLKVGVVSAASLRSPWRGADGCTALGARRVATPWTATPSARRPPATVGAWWSTTWDCGSRQIAASSCGPR